MRLEVLIRQGREQLKQFTDGKTRFIAYVRSLREQIQHCLVDVVDRGEPAQDELRELVTMDLSISDELAAWYAKHVYNDFEVKEGDPADFLRAQAEYDRAIPAKIQRMIDILETVRGKMLGIGLQPALSSPGNTEAYLLKESLDRLWNYHYEGAMLRYLQSWVDPVVDGFVGSLVAFDGL